MFKRVKIFTIILNFYINIKMFPYPRMMDQKTDVDTCPGSATY